MKKSCSYCGGIHNVGFECPKRPKREYKKNKYSEANADIKRFRNSSIWQKKREEIQDRDLHLCAICIRGLYNTINQYSYEDTSVHHIYKISERPDLKLSNKNLVTLCNQHHTDADLGVIPINVLLEIAKEQEEK